MPTDTDLRTARREAILEIVGEGSVSSQAALVESLEARGFSVTQSSVSRDLQELGVAKVRGAYRVIEAAQASLDETLEAVAPLLRDASPAGPHLTVLHTAIGAAQGVAVVIDRAAWPEVVGTVAGDDTLFIATSGRPTQRRLLARLRPWLTE
ncbi:MAG: arginine repressor [Planctomycetota bacterium]